MMSHKKVLNTSVSVLALGLGLALFGSHPALASCTTGGTISTDLTSTQSWGSGNCSVTAAGTINASTGQGISVSANVGTLSNSGLVSGYGTGAFAGSGISNYGTIGTLTNSGTLTGGYTPPCDPVIEICGKRLAMAMPTMALADRNSSSLVRTSGRWSIILDGRLTGRFCGNSREGRSKVSSTSSLGRLPTKAASYPTLQGVVFHSGTGQSWPDLKRTLTTSVSILNKARHSPNEECRTQSALIKFQPKSEVGIEPLSSKIRGQFAATNSNGRETNATRTKSAF